MNTQLKRMATQVGEMLCVSPETGNKLGIWAVSQNGAIGLGTPDGREFWILDATLHESTEIEVKGLSTRDDFETVAEQLEYAQKGMASNSRIMMGACKLLHASGIDCGSKAICDAMREIRAMEEANRELREALEKAEHSLTWGDSKMKGRPPQHWTGALTQVRETLAKHKPLSTDH